MNSNSELAWPDRKQKRKEMEKKKEEKKSESFDTDPIPARFIGGHSISDDRPVELVAFRSADKVEEEEEESMRRFRKLRRGYIEYREIRL